MPFIVVDSMSRRLPIASGRLPALPEGFEAQPAWAYSEPSTRIICQLFRVFGDQTAAVGEGLVPTRRLDRARSFWVVTEPLAEHRTDLRAISFGEASEWLGPSISFDRFCSLAGLVQDLGALLRLPAPPWIEPDQGDEHPDPVDLRAAAAIGTWFVA